MRFHLCLGQLNTEFLYFLPELPDDASVGVFIDDSMVNYVLCSVGIAQCGQGLLVVVSCWTHSRDHGCAAVAPQAVLETAK